VRHRRMTAGQWAQRQNALGLNGSVHRGDEHLGWRHELKGLAGSEVELGGDGVEVGLGVAGEAGGLRRCWRPVLPSRARRQIAATSSEDIRARSIAGSLRQADRHRSPKVMR
jgi:hypothetical protein